LVVGWTAAAPASVEIIPETMNRRHALKTIAVGAASTFTMPPVLRAGLQSRRGRPNLLVIMSDQHAARWCGFGGDRIVRTPHLNRLAERGVVFENAYCNSPICVPSRMSFLTGRHVQHIGIWDNHTILPSETPTFAHGLMRAGYDVVLNGKMHFRGPDKLHGFRAQLSADPAGDDPGSFPIPRWREGGRVPLRPHIGTALTFGEGIGKREDYEAEAAAVSYLEDPARRAQPWAMVVGIYAPHPPWQAQREYLDQYRREEIPLPHLPAGYVEHQHPVHRRKRELWQKAEFPDEMVRGARHTYFALTTRVDDQIGRVLAALERSGQREDTLVVYTSDHGEMLGEHALWNKSSLLEESAHVPMIFSWPGTLTEGRRVAECVSLVDLTATLLDFAGAPRDLPLDGRSLQALASGTDRNWPDEAISELYATWTDRPIAMLRRGRYKLHLSHQERPQLYDLKRDPREFDDLAADPAHATILGELTRRLTSRWDSDRLNQRVLESQDQRLAQSNHH
jgi:choline-sulfatase